jgi:cob(I)alamin adenosyltransferase
MAIYTRTGDKGKTSLFDGTRVLKSHHRVETYGTIDELNSMIGVICAEIFLHKKSQEQLKLTSVSGILLSIQHDLFTIGSFLATPHPKTLIDLSAQVKAFELLIDDLTGQMPKIAYFIIPGGGRIGALLHVVRTITRRAERQLVALMQCESIDETIVMYLNRLSDLLFTMARFVNHIEKQKEIRWGKKYNNK